MTANDPSLSPSLYILRVLQFVSVLTGCQPAISGFDVGESQSRFLNTPLTRLEK